MQNTPPEAPEGAVRAYIQSTLLGGRMVSDQDELLLSGMIDSLGMMSLVTFVEQTYGIEIPFEDVTLENFGTISVMTTYAETRRASLG